MLSKDGFDGESLGGIFLLGPNMLSANVSLSTGNLQEVESWISLTETGIVPSRS